MSKLAVYLSILGTVFVGLNLLGVIDNTGTSALLSWLANPNSLFTSEFYTSLNNILSLFAVTGIIIGFFISTKTDLTALIGFIPLLFMIGKDMLALYNLLALYVPYIAILIFSPFLLVYLLTVIEWWRAVT